MNFFNKNSWFLLFKSNLFLGILFLSVFYSCGPSRHLNQEQHLLTKVKVEEHSGGEYEENLYSLAKQKPNRKFLGLFKIYLGVYNLFYSKEDSKIRNKIGEPPVIYDSALSQKSILLMQKYLENKGYYESEIKLEQKLKRKKAKIVYKVTKGDRYYISKLALEIPDQKIKNIIDQDSATTLMKVGKPFDTEILAQERERIETQLKNAGYYKFFREYVIFKVDTNMDRNEAEVTMQIKSPQKKVGKDSTKSLDHQKYRISKVMVRIGIAPGRKQRAEGDTTLLDSIYFVDFTSDRYRKKLLSVFVSLRKGMLYQLDKQEQTYQNLSSLGLFDQINIHFEEDFSSPKPSLIAYIDLNPRLQQSYTLESEGTNNGGNLGINATINYQNINTFRGGERLSLGLSGGLEAQRILTEEDESEIASGALGFNTIEFGPRLSLEIPRFLLPFNFEQWSPERSPRTTFNLSFNFQDRPDYTRNVTKMYVAYSWNQSKTVSHVLQPFDLSFAKISLSNSFENLLNEIQNPFLRNSYTDNLIMALSYSYIYNDQKVKKSKNNNFFRLNLESAGNFISLATDGLNNNENEDGSFNIANIRYAQYFKMDFDYRHYQNFEYNQLVYRFASGLGLPYGNSVAMPFEKSFFAGGANSNRAWRARDLGPGTLPDSVQQNIDQIGNMKIELNFEFRFPVSGILEGAAFVDAGNIWNFNQEDSREETRFELDKLWDGTAIGIGLGVRLNFSFFIFRLDFAAPFKDPAEIDPNALELQLNRTNLNLGIGYPF